MVPLDAIRYIRILRTPGRREGRKGGVIVAIRHSGHRGSDSNG